MFPMAPEGRIFAIGTAWMAVLTLLFGYTAPGAFLVSLAIALMLVFRQFTRRPLPKVTGLVAPADAVVVAITPETDPFTGAPAQRITLRQNRLGEYHLFSPLEAQVEQRRGPGVPVPPTAAPVPEVTPPAAPPAPETQSAATPAAAPAPDDISPAVPPAPETQSAAATATATLPNPPNPPNPPNLSSSILAWSLRTPEGVTVSLGYEPRGLSFLRVGTATGTRLKRAQRLGFAGFGGRVHLWLPEGADILVRPGQQLRAGADLLGGLAGSGTPTGTNPTGTHPMRPSRHE